jgi:hypothetical protein
MPPKVMLRLIALLFPKPTNQVLILTVSISLCREALVVDFVQFTILRLMELETYCIEDMNT